MARTLVKAILVSATCIASSASASVTVSFVDISLTDSLILESLDVDVPQGETLLFERSLSVNRSVNIFNVNEFDVDLALADAFFNPTSTVSVFDDLIITPADVGSVFQATAATDPGLASAAGRVTDGLNEVVRLIFTENEAGGLSEERGFFENMFFTGVSTPFVPDLAGAVVSRISLRVDSFTLAPPTAVTAGPPVDLRLTVSFFSAIPEPTTGWLFAAALVTLTSVRSRGATHR